MVANPPSARLLNTLAPPPSVDTLPVELLSYIFVLATHAPVELPQEMDDTYRLPPFTTESVETPRILSVVSRHWREVALRTATLWTSLCITAEMIEYPDDDGDSDNASIMSSLSSSKSMRSASSRSSRPSTGLNTHHLRSCLKLSRNYPLNIIIDARDQDWDFHEPEAPSEYENDTYTPPFSSSFMHTVTKLLTPHLYRWRSIDVLTDSWAPMYVALREMSNQILISGAPMLESLTLMRCNDFVSYGTEFQPSHLKEPIFLRNYDSSASLSPAQPLFPKLNNLVLRGVHIDWDALAQTLSLTNTECGSGLRILELSSHCPDVRPTLTQFHDILAASPALAKLVINGSGPIVPPSTSSASSSDVSLPTSLLPPPTDSLLLSDGAISQIPLPSLKHLTIGYRSTTLEAQRVLEMLDAPNVRALVLEDGTYLGDPEDVDGGRLMKFIGSSRVPTDDSDDSDVGELKDQDRAMFPSLESVLLKRVKSRLQPLRVFFGALHSLEKIELVGMTINAVQALVPPYQPPSSSLSSTTSSTAENIPRSPCLNLTDESAMRITPSPPPTPSLLLPAYSDHLATPCSSRTHCPCPNLEVLLIRRLALSSPSSLSASAAAAALGPPYNQQLRIEDIHHVIGQLASERSAKGAVALRQVDVYVDGDGFGPSSFISNGKKIDGKEYHPDGGDDAGGVIGSGGVQVTIKREEQLWSSDSDCEMNDGDEYSGGDDDDEEAEEEEEEDPWAPGGAFNDPEFDAYYAPRSVPPIPTLTR